ncbi:MAG: hypothetical protein ACPGU5_00980 [Lishizhenia sp.]
MRISSFENATPERANVLYKKDFKDSLSVLKSLREARLFDIEQGYALANIDAIEWTNKSAHVHYFKGEKFKTIQLTVLEEDKAWLFKSTGMTEKLIKNLPFKSNDLKQLIKKSLIYAENNGYPFAKIELTDASFKEGNLYVSLTINKGPKMIFDEIILKGDSSIAKKYLVNYINIKENDNYSELKLRQISNRIQQLPFLKEIKAHEVLFTPKGVKLYLYLESIPVSNINGIVGLQQDPTTFQSRLTGEIQLKLQNVLKRGELLSFNWRSIQPETQQLNVLVNYPFLLNSPFGLDAGFDLYKRDSTFLTTKTQLGTQYFLSGGNYLKAFYEADISNLLSGASNGTSNLKLSNVRVNNYGIGLYRRRLDYIQNPRKGLILDMKGSVGLRNSSSLDSTATEKSTTYKFETEIDWYIPLAKRHVLRVNNKTASYYAEEIFFNELYRFGGLKSQRGFNEEELFATTFSLTRLEYRFIVDKDAHAFAFYDQSFYENNSDKYYQDNPIGFGLGFSFGTNIGIFSLSYALGKQFDNPILLREGKVHFGYIAYF